ncbi:response regulator [Aquibium oceanicum]|uniref:Response regulatory domain-containing protein n=1 Tax=Aquibium oceanicum TaxID=1670800 RepID=A0A1L3SVA4_9HYPH|nr:response regulator [Aquibium oceanicum]APH73308.1 hypothetical protein BSQ44_19470 [Aquibium oceanicum]
MFENREDRKVNAPQVLVVGNSSVNCIVVSRVVERMGLKVRTERPESAALALRETSPAIVILDGGADNRDCDGLLGDLQKSREATEGALPAVILLSTANIRPDTLAAPAVDMVISKPLTVDRLQPAIDALRARNGDFARKSG